MKNFILLSALLFLTASCNAQNKTEMNKDNGNYEVKKTEKEWQEQLSPEEYYVLRQKGTERPFTGEYNMHFEEGTYNCRACDAPLFTSDSKFDSHLFLT